jgi:rhamnopyranosyl-N-acetylglucosaminyl-diphospho-decaprenol beta-1,3/1,4-galactofuranosyltransferase
MTTDESEGAQLGERVAVVMLTHNARQSLERCLAAITRQSTRPGAILITDNASSETVEDLVAGIDGATVTRLPENVGPAGGYAAALTAFLASGFEWAWVMDDDCVPVPDALATQLSLSRPDRIVLATVQWAETGEVVRGNGWWGALIPRAVVARVGVPNPELFWWTEDTEYLQWRIPQAGYDVVWTEEPLGTVSRGRPDASKPAWKYYYEARNQVFHRLHVQRPSTSPPPENLLLRVRAWRAARSVGKLAVRAATREHEHRGAKLVMVGRGAVDGLFGRLGHTVPVDDSDRPTFTHDH